MANPDDTSTELNRTTLGAVLSRVFEDNDPTTLLPGRARIAAAELRALAEKLDTL